MERSSQYTLFSSRKQPANAGSERRYLIFTENASVAPQQTTLTHTHTKCPAVPGKYLFHWPYLRFLVSFQFLRPFKLVSQEDLTFIHTLLEDSGFASVGELRTAMLD